jgi:hypothetical protein
MSIGADAWSVQMPVMSDVSRWAADRAQCVSYALRAPIAACENNDAPHH